MVHIIWFISGKDNCLINGYLYHQVTISTNLFNTTLPQHTILSPSFPNKDSWKAWALPALNEISGHFIICCDQFTVCCDQFTVCCDQFIVNLHVTVKSITTEFWNIFLHKHFSQHLIFKSNLFFNDFAV